MCPWGLALKGVTLHKWVNFTLTPCAHAVGQLDTTWGDLTPLPSMHQQVWHEWNKAGGGLGGEGAAPPPQMHGGAHDFISPRKQPPDIKTGLSANLPSFQQQPAPCPLLTTTCLTPPFQTHYFTSRRLTTNHSTSSHLQPTSWHQNRSHHHQGASPSWNGCTFVHTRTAVWAPHWSDALYTSSRHAFGTALVRRLAHVVCASFYFGTTHVLLGKTVAMGGCNLKMKKGWRGVGGRAQRLPPRCRVTCSIHTDVAAWVCLIYRLRSWFWHSPGSSPCARCVCKFLLWYHSCPSWQDCGHGRRQPKNINRWRGVGGEGAMSLHEYASCIDVYAVVPTHHLRTNHIISHFGTSHVLILGKIVAMGGGNLKIKTAGGGLGGRAQRLPPRCRVTRSIHTDVAAWVCLIYRLRSWNQPNCAYMRRCPDTSPQNQPHYFLLWYQSCPSWQDCGHGRRQPKNDKKLEGGWGEGATPPPQMQGHTLYSHRCRCMSMSHI